MLGGNALQDGEAVRFRLRHFFVNAADGSKREGGAKPEGISLRQRKDKTGIGKVGQTEMTLKETRRSRCQRGARPLGSFPFVLFFLDAVRHSARLEILLRHLGSALRRLAPLTAAMDRLEDADQKICPAR